MVHIQEAALERAPSHAEAKLAREAGIALKRAADGKTSMGLRVLSAGPGSNGQQVVLPETAARLLLGVLDQLASGNAVALVPLHAELSTQQAADLLNVSQPYVVRLIEAGELPCRTVGTHRRVRVDDLLAYRRRLESERERGLAELAEETRQLGLGN